MSAKFAIDSKHPMGKRLWAIGGCVAALALVQLLSPGTTSPALGFGPVRLLVVLASFCGLAWWLLKRLPRAGASGLEPALKVIGKAALGPKNGLALIEADGIRVLVAYGDGFSSVLPLDAVGAQKVSAS